MKPHVDLMAPEPDKTRADVATECPKRAYRSLAAARAAHRHAHFRIRVYECPDCGFLHVTHYGEKP